MCVRERERDYHPSAKIICKLNISKEEDQSYRGGRWKTVLLKLK